MYVKYQDEQEVQDLDQNSWQGPIAQDSPNVSFGMLGMDLYTMVGNGPRRQAYGVCNDGGRDVRTQYIIGLERENHPDHSAWFGYGRCRYGYCFGHMPGKYIENDHCAGYDPLPSDMAPKRFYTEKYTSPFSCLSQGRVDYDIGKNYLMRDYW